MDTWHNVGHDLSSKQKVNLGQKNHLFCVLMRGREIERRKESIKILSTIYGALFVGFRQAKDKGSSHRRGVDMGTKKEGF